MSHAANFVVLAAEGFLDLLEEQGILQELGALSARLKSPELSDTESRDIMERITELQRIRSEAKNS